MKQQPSSHSDQLWLSILGVDIALLLLLGWSFLYLEPASPSYVIGQASAAVLVVTLAGVLTALYSDWTPF